MTASDRVGDDSSLKIPCQRWQTGAEAWRDGRERIDVARHEVRLIDEGDAKAFIERHHYSRSYPAARLRVGLFRKDPFRRETLAGVAVFSVPMNQNAVSAHTGLPAERGVELGRFVLLDEVEGNGETFFLARALRRLNEALPEVEAVLSYSDPVPRIVEGRTLKPGHVGVIYQAGNFRHVGRARARTLLVSRRTGLVVSERALTKLKSGDRGRDYALRQLRALGAPAMRRGEAAGDYLLRVRQSDAFLRVRHPGNHIYIHPVGDRKVRRAFFERARPGLPYPKVPEGPCVLG